MVVAMLIQVVPLGALAAPADEAPHHHQVSHPGSAAAPCCDPAPEAPTCGDATAGCAHPCGMLPPATGHDGAAAPSASPTSPTPVDTSVRLPPPQPPPKP